MDWLERRIPRILGAALVLVVLVGGVSWVALSLRGAPLLAVAKVVCDRLESLKPVGEMLGR